MPNRSCANGEMAETCMAQEPSRPDPNEGLPTDASSRNGRQRRAISASLVTSGEGGACPTASGQKRTVGTLVELPDSGHCRGASPTGCLKGIGQKGAKAGQIDRGRQQAV
jgi:hypothetical protein